MELSTIHIGNGDAIFNLRVLSTGKVKGGSGQAPRLGRVVFSGWFWVVLFSKGGMSGGICKVGSRAFDRVMDAEITEE